MAVRSLLFRLLQRPLGRRNKLKDGQTSPPLPKRAVSDPTPPPASLPPPPPPPDRAPARARAAEQQQQQQQKAPDSGAGAGPDAALPAAREGGISGDSLSSSSAVSVDSCSSSAAANHDHERRRAAAEAAPASPASSVGHLEGAALWEKLDGAGQRAVALPDLFSSMMAVECAICPHYEAVREQSESYINRTWSFDEKTQRKNHLINFAYMAAAWAPLADEETLLLLTDWLHWTFYFDDQFDEGHLSADPEAAIAEIKRTLVLFEEDAPFCSVDEYPLGHVFQDVWARFRKRAANKDLERRYIKSIRDYCDGVMHQVRVHATGAVIGLDQYMAFRRASIGSYPSFALIEVCHGIDLPQYVVDHKSIAVCEEVATDITVLHNDALSYKKDLVQRVPHNIIILLQTHGLSEQQAIDRVDGMLADCFRRWYGALAELPAWGEKIDRDVLRYLDLCRNVALGNLYWSFESGRYFGKDGAKVRETKVMELP